MNYSLVGKYLGLMSIAVGVSMTPALACSFLFGETRSEFSFGISIVISVLVGLLLWAYGRNGSDTMHQREALTLVGFSWILTAALGALPFVFSGVFTNFADAFFESMSGFTTTGASVLQDIETAPKSILFWRSFTQWLGGIGIVVLFIAILPRLGAGGKQLFKLEVPGPEHPTMQANIRDSSKRLFWLYIGLSAVLLSALMLSGLGLFDALCHMFSTISTGGFSPKQASVADYDNPILETILMVFMLIAAVNFGLYFPLLKGRGQPLLKDTECRLYIAILCGATLLIALYLSGIRPPVNEALAAVSEDGAVVEQLTYPFTESLRKAAFQVVSISTTTGFVSDDFDAWPDFCRMMLVVLMVMGGCGGSTAGGFKVIRIILLSKMAYWRLEKLFRPKTIRLVRLRGQVVEDVVLQRLGGFFGLYLFCLVAGTLIMSGFGLPIQSAASAVVSTVNNIGPGLDMVGATKDYSFLSAPAKLFLSFCMVLGRLELFTICALLMPSFWLSRWTH